MTGWLTRLRDRPIAEQERGVAMAGVLAVVVLAALALTLTQPVRPGSKASAARGASGQQAAAHEGLAPLTPLAVETAKGFLEGYLAYLYGHTPAANVHDGTPSLARALRAERLRVTPGMHSLTPHVVALSPVPASAGLVGVRALVNDGGLIDYPIVLLLEHAGGRLFVTGLGGS